MSWCFCSSNTISFTKMIRGEAHYLSQDVFSVLSGASFVTPAKWSKIHIGVSSCQLGALVSYDGRHRPPRMRFLMSILSVVPVCPEMEMGLGVPRPPIRLINKPHASKTVLSTSDGKELSGLLDAHIDAFTSVAVHLDGFVGKRGSPTCGGLNTIVTFSPDGTRQGKRADVQGAFRDSIAKKWPDMPSCDGADFLSWSQTDSEEFWKKVLSRHNKRVSFS